MLNTKNVRVLVEGESPTVEKRECFCGRFQKQVGPFEVIPSVLCDASWSLSIEHACMYLNPPNVFIKTITRVQGQCPSPVGEGRWYGTPRPQERPDPTPREPKRLQDTTQAQGPGAAMASTPREPETHPRSEQEGPPTHRPTQTPP